MKPSDTSDAQASGISDDALIEAYEETSGVPGDAAADALLAEIRRRELDV